MIAHSPDSCEVVAVGGTKGGVGKSTIAINLAIMRALDGKDVLLIDTDDDQGTSFDFSLLRVQEKGDAGYTFVKLAGPAVRSEVVRLKTKYESIVIDCGAHDTQALRATITVTNVLLNPFEPSTFDVWTIHKDLAVLKEMRAVNPTLRAYTFLNKADTPPNVQDNEEAAEQLREITDCIFHETWVERRKVFRHAAAAGIGVVEVKDHATLRRKYDPEAVDQLLSLYAIAFEPIAVTARATSVHRDRPAAVLQGEVS